MSGIMRANLLDPSTRAAGPGTLASIELDILAVASLDTVSVTAAATLSRMTARESTRRIGKRRRERRSHPSV
jgi:hypothetical protein